MFDFFRPWKGLKVPFYLITGSLIFGTLGFKILFPHESLLRLLYMTGITLTTVGYSDILGVQSNPSAIVFNLFIMISGMGVVLYSTSLVTAYIVEGNLKNAFALERLRRRIKKMEDHYIICGAGETGIHVIKEMMESEVPCVVIESCKEKKEEILEIYPKLPVIIGDATLDHVLSEAGIVRAKGLVAVLSNDKDNLYLTLSAKMLRPGLSIVARAVELTMIKKLKKAGASRVVSPNFLGGVQMASGILRPNVTNFMEMISRGEDRSIRVEEIEIPNESKVIGMSLGEANFFESCGVNILAIARHADQYYYTPGPDFIVEQGDILLYIGNDYKEKLLEDVLNKSIS